MADSLGGYSMNESEIQELVNKIKEVEEEIGKAIIGQKDVINKVLIAIFTGGNVLRKVHQTRKLSGKNLG